jgi:hypothetical protein
VLQKVTQNEVKVHLLNFLALHLPIKLIVSIVELAYDLLAIKGREYGIKVSRK